MVELADGQAEAARALYTEHQWIVEEIRLDYTSRVRGRAGTRRTGRATQASRRNGPSSDMESLLIKGGVPLEGEVWISGAKNAALPIMAATLLTPEPCIIHRVPDLSDVRFMAQILNWLGASVTFKNGTLRIEARTIKGHGDYDLVRKMRGSICIMGPLLARLKRARVSLPGGCVIGARPINLHLKGFEALGAKITIEGGYVQASARRQATLNGALSRWRARALARRLAAWGGTRWGLRAAGWRLWAEREEANITNIVRSSDVSQQAGCRPRFAGSLPQSRVPIH